MISEQSKSVAERAKAIYADRLRPQLEANHPGRFVAIEPDSGDYFLAYSERISFVIRIGHETAIHLGGIAT
jgi:hypothetical protein